tara:strand:- start:271 stop:963 length:693 start_codon:yes stop_codon:yes gene_type:complete
MPYSINTVAAVQSQTGLKIGIVGASGVGKTPLALTTPNPERTLIVDVDRGLKSLGSASIPVVTVSDPNQLTEILQDLNAGMGASYDWIIIDDTSAVAELWLQDARVLLPGDKWGQFEHVARKTIETIVGFRNLAQHVVFIAKASQNKNGQWVPHFPGLRVEKEWPYLLDSIGYMRAVIDDNGTPRRFIQFQPDGEYQAKDRNGRLTYEECNLTTIAQKIFPSEQQQTQGE